MYNQLHSHFDLNSISVKHTGNHYLPPQDLGLKVEQIWKLAKDKYGDKLWNGVNYRLERLEIENGKPTFYLGTADYKVNYTAKELAGDIMALPFDERPKCMYVSTLLQTTDHKFVLGQTAAAGIHGGTTALLGGVLNQDEMEISSGTDLENYLYKELDEEMEIKRSMIISSHALGVYEMPTCRIGTFMTTRLALSSDEFRQQIRINDEHDGYAIVTREDILKENVNPSTRVNRGVFLALNQLDL